MNVMRPYVGFSNTGRRVVCPSVNQEVATKVFNEVLSAYGETLEKVELYFQ